MTTKLGDSFNRVSNWKVKIKLAPLCLYLNTGPFPKMNLWVD